MLPLWCRTGIVQGDPLSPLLFIIAIDPLMRWIVEGDKGYKMATNKEKIPALAYADDLGVLASYMNDVHVCTSQETPIILQMGRV